MIVTLPWTDAMHLAVGVSSLILNQLTGLHLNTVGKLFQCRECIFLNLLFVFPPLIFLLPLANESLTKWLNFISDANQQSLLLDASYKH